MSVPKIITVTTISENEKCILDASIFTSYHHCDKILRMREKFFVSETLYDILFEDKYKHNKEYVVKYFGPRGVRGLPNIKYDLKSMLVKYTYKKEYVEDIMTNIKEFKVPEEVKNIILDQYSFLKEHSISLMSTRKFAKLLYKLGIPIVDALNKGVDWKRKKLEPIRGLRWIIGLLIAFGTAVASPATALATSASYGGIGVALFDP